MKILCDVCTQEEASVLCIADEAVLCPTCDTAVHCANKLAGKHHRLALRRSPSGKPTLCDICKGKRALLFCQEDRSILCKDCDSKIHKVNELTMKHARFLLTGVGIETSQSPESVTTLKRKRSPPPATSTISDYFIKTLPGWRVDDFLDSSSSSYQTFTVAEEGKNPRRGYDLIPTNNQIQISEMMGFKGKNKNWIESEENLFAVPQISPPNSCKRSFC